MAPFLKCGPLYESSLVMTHSLIIEGYYVVPPKPPRGCLMYLLLGEVGFKGSLSENV